MIPIKNPLLLKNCKTVSLQPFLQAFKAEQVFGVVPDVQHESGSINAFPDTPPV